MQVNLIRQGEKHNATLGVLEVEGLDVVIYTLEDAWNDNSPNISSIPPGKYVCTPHNWKERRELRFKRVWRLLRVPNRTAILIHAGNDHEDTHGCILVGLKRDLSNSAFIGDSVKALNILREHIGEKTFTINIVEACAPL